MIRLSLCLALLMTNVTFAQGRTIEMICKNPRQEYTVIFDEVSKSFRVGETPYDVLAVEKTSERFVVVGLTVNDGQTFRAHFLPYKMMEFFKGKQLYQADGCR